MNPLLSDTLIRPPPLGKLLSSCFASIIPDMPSQLFGNLPGLSTPLPNECFQANKPTPGLREILRPKEGNITT